MKRTKIHRRRNITKNFEGINFFYLNKEIKIGKFYVIKFS